MDRFLQGSWIRQNSVCSLAVCALLLCGTKSFAAPPKVNYLFPSGGQRGQSVVVTANGDFGAWPASAWADRPGVAVVAEKEKGKFRVTIAADASPGIVWLRFHDGEGAALLRPFAIGDLAEVEEKEPNDTIAKSQQISAPTTINGRLEKNSDLDGYSLTLKKGETLVAAVQAHSLFGAPLDGILQVCEIVERRSSSSEGAEPELEAFVVEQNHDMVGLDPRIVFVVPRDGRYLVRFFAHSAEPNSNLNFAGGEGYVYRLTLTTGGFVEFTMPLAVRGKESAEVRLHGPGINAEKAALTLPEPVALGDPFPNAESTSRIASLPQVAGSFAVPVSHYSSLLVASSARPQSPQEVQPPVVLSGLLAEPRQVDAFKLAAKKGERLLLRVESRSLGLPLDGVLTIVDGEGKMLAENDDAEKKADPSLIWTAPKDGEYFVRLRDLHRRGGPRMAYRLTIASEPDFTLSLAADSFLVKAGGKVEIPVTIARRADFKEPIRIRAVGLPEGITQEEAISQPQGESAKSVKLVLAATAGAMPRGVPLRVEGQIEGSDKLPATAHFPVALPLAEPHWAVWLTVQKP